MIDRKVKTELAGDVTLHERSLAEDIWRNVAQLLAGHGAARPVSMTLSVGEFAGVDPRLLVEATAEVLDEAGYTGVAIDVQTIPLQARCHSCDEGFDVQRFRFECPQCGGRDVAVERGEGLVLESVTLETADADLPPNSHLPTAD
jgi:hydrogenase nickel incorporation protein HypA/HybF